MGEFFRRFFPSKKEAEPPKKTTRESTSSHTESQQEQERRLKKEEFERIKEKLAQQGKSISKLENASNGSQAGIRTENPDILSFFELNSEVALNQPLVTLTVSEGFSEKEALEAIAEKITSQKITLETNEPYNEFQQKTGDEAFNLSITIGENADSIIKSREFNRFAGFIRFLMQKSEKKVIVGLLTPHWSSDEMPYEVLDNFINLMHIP